ncbi:hypothetical protein GCM10009665_09550 [Kitasatospora nipponensis]|uniref:Tip attachment protein J domain-containing protein n=1 Tax=Kitasatospora nipponensis TaxID=258049 RepID=A0ABP4GD36_9ACTN
MQPADAAFAAALVAGTRCYGHTTRLAGQDLAAQVQSWRVERAYTTDLPAAMRAFTGSSSAQLDLRLCGAYGVNAPALYSPWAPTGSGDVVRPGQSVVQTTGLNTGLQLPVFRGTVRSRSADSGTDTVQITALDGAERLRGPAHLPRPYPAAGAGRPIASATWCVDELLRQAFIDTCPPPRYRDEVDGAPATLLYASLHGGFAATHGTPQSVPDPSAYSWSRAAAPYELAVVPAQSGLTMSWKPRTLVVVPGSGVLLEVTVNTLVGAPRGHRVSLGLVLDRAGSDYGGIQLTVDFATGVVTAFSGLYGSATGQSATWSFPTLVGSTGLWHLAAVVDTGQSPVGTSDGRGNWVTRAPVVVPMLRAPDGTLLTGPGATLGPAGNQPLAEIVGVELVTDFAAECLQLTGGITAQWPLASLEQRDWSRGATLDEVTLPLYSVPVVSGSQWDVIGEIAKAALGTAEFDESGVFRWRNHTRFLTAPTRPQRTLTSVGEIASLTVSEEIDACRNYCVQPYQDWSQVAWTTETVVLDSQVEMIPPNDQRVLTYLMDEQEYDVGAPVPDDDVKVQPDGSVLRFAAAGVAGAAPAKGAISTGATRSGGTLTLTLRNRSTVPLYPVARAGGSSLQVVTHKPQSDPVQRQAVAQDPLSQAKYGLQQYTADATGWVQDPATAQALANALGTAGAFPAPLFGGVEVLYDPRLQLGDVVELVDFSGAYLDQLAWVVGLTVEASEDGAVQQTLTLRGTAANLGPGNPALVPDPPVDAAVWTRRSYGQVRAGYPTYGDLTATGASCRDLLSH